MLLNPLLTLTFSYAQDLEFTLPAKAIQYYSAGPKPALGFDAPNLKEFMKTPVTLDSISLKALMRTPTALAAQRLQNQPLKFPLKMKKSMIAKLQRLMKLKA